MVWFWQLRGRRLGGVFVIFAPPGEGKSYVATAIGLELMEDGIDVYSNFPIVSVDGKYCSKVFTPDLMSKNLNGKAVIIDEGYTLFNARKYIEFTDADHDWFATSGHNEMMIYVIAQNYARIDKVIREVCNLIIEVKKVKIPIFDLPLWFTAESWLSVDDFKDSKYHDIAPYRKERFRFSVDVALAYDTKFFRKVTEPPYEGKNWIEYFAEKNMEYRPINLNIIQKLKYVYYDKLKTKVIENLQDGLEKCSGFVQEQLNRVGVVRGLIGSKVSDIRIKINGRYGDGCIEFWRNIRQKFRKK